jgi:hypothetical protein
MNTFQFIMSIPLPNSRGRQTDFRFIWPCASAWSPEQDENGFKMYTITYFPMPQIPWNHENDFTGCLHLNQRKTACIKDLQKQVKQGQYICMWQWSYRFSSSGMQVPCGINFAGDINSLEISVVFHPLRHLSSAWKTLLHIDTDSNRPLNDVLSLDGTHISVPISAHHWREPKEYHETFSDWRELIGLPMCTPFSNKTLFSGQFESVSTWSMESSLSSGRKTALISKECMVTWGSW